MRCFRGMIVISLILQDEDGKLPDGHPIIMEATNPRGQKYARQIQKYNYGNFIYLFKIPTSDDVPTGIWNVEFKVGGSV